MQKEGIIFMNGEGGNGSMDEIKNGGLPGKKEQRIPEKISAGADEKRNPGRAEKPESAISKEKGGVETRGRLPGIMGIGQKIVEFDGLSPDEKNEIKSMREERKKLSSEEWEKLSADEKEKMNLSETWEKLSEHKVVDDGEEKSGIDVLKVLSEEFGKNIETGEISDKSIGAFDLLIKLVEKKSDTEAGKAAGEWLIKDYLGGGDEAQGKDVYETLIKPMTQARSGEDFRKIDDDLLNSLREEVSAGGVQPPDEEKGAATSPNEAVSVQQGAENPAEAPPPVPTEGTGQGNGAVDGKSGTERLKKKFDPDVWLKEHEEKIKRGAYTAGTIMLLLLIMYFKSTAEFAAFIEMNAERQRRAGV